MPVKNGEKFIKNTISSLLNQTFSDLEIVAVNDHSEDNTLNILKEIAKQDERLKVFNMEDKTGIAAGRNLGTQNANGEIILPTDADDPCYPERAAISIEELEKNKADVFYANLMRVYSDTGKKVLRHFQPYDKEMLHYINFIGHGASAFYKKVYDTAGPYDESILIGEDYDFFLNAEENGFKFVSKNIPVSQYTMHPGQTTGVVNDAEKIKKRQLWNKKVREKHSIYNIDPEYVRKNGTPEVVDFYINSNYEIWFGPESIPTK